MAACGLLAAAALAPAAARAQSFTVEEGITVPSQTMSFDGDKGLIKDGGSAVGVVMAAANQTLENFGRISLVGGSTPEASGPLAPTPRSPIPAASFPKAMP